MENLNRTVDLHVHSNVSDGVDTPEALVSLAMSKQLAAFALTDHDTTDGVERAAEEAKRIGSEAPEVISGVEISASYGGRDIHILGLFVNPHCEKLQRELAITKEKRILRNKLMCQKFCDAGISMTMEELCEGKQDSVLTRAHFAKVLLQKGIVATKEEAFAEYLGEDKPFYVVREYMDPEVCIQSIHEAGGLAIAAHPLQYKFSREQLHVMIRTLRQMGLDGIEAIYNCYSKEEEDMLRSLANAYQLSISGGSDYHGSNKPGLMLGVGYGSLKVPYEVLEQLREKRA